MAVTLGDALYPPRLREIFDPPILLYARGRVELLQALMLGVVGTRRPIAYGIAVAEKRVHVHDFHATILHLMGLDHEKLTFRYAGRDFRLTDVHGEIVEGILA